MHSIKIGTIVNANLPDPAGYIRQILPRGFECFSLSFGPKDEGRRSARGDLPRLADEIMQAMEGSDAVISSVGVYGNPLETEPLDLETLRTWEDLIDNAHLFGTNIVGGFTGRLRGRSIDDSVPRFREVFGSLADRALGRPGRGVRIAFENCAMDGNWRTGDWNIAHGPDAWHLLFEAVPSPNIGLEWEPCHQMINLIDPLPQLREWVPRIFHVHGKDATIMWDVVRKYGVNCSKPYAFHRTPGFGDTNWTDIFSELRRGGFSGAIDIEGWHDPVYRDELEMTGQVHALNYLKGCRGGDFVPNPM
jgi:sugar phosphate isomerase/epimerase